MFLVCTLQCCCSQIRPPWVVHTQEPCMKPLIADARTSAGVKVWFRKAVQLSLDTEMSTLCKTKSSKNLWLSSTENLRESEIVKPGRSAAAAMAETFAFNADIQQLMSLTLNWARERLSLGSTSPEMISRSVQKTCITLWGDLFDSLVIFLIFGLSGLLCSLARSYHQHVLFQQGDLFARVDLQCVGCLGQDPVRVHH